MELNEQVMFGWKIDLEKLITEREGYIADNKQREMRGEVIAYVERDFDRIRTKMNKLKLIMDEVRSAIIGV